MRTRIQIAEPENDVVRNIEMDSPDESNYEPEEAESEDANHDSESAEEENIEKLQKKTSGQGKNNKTRGNWQDVTRARTTSATPSTIVSTQKDSIAKLVKSKGSGSRYVFIPSKPI